MAAIAVDPTIRRQLVAVAREVLAEDAAAPVERIARAAGMSRATVYRHFGSRAALLDTIAFEAPPDSRTRILLAAQEMLVSTSLAELSMDRLAHAAGVSRGTFYRLFPGKGALLQALIEAFSPFEAVRAILAEHGEDPPEAVLPLVARAVVGVAEERRGLLRAIFHETTIGSGPALAGFRPVFESTISDLLAYVRAQMAGGRLRAMHPLLALQAFMSPIFFHLLTRPTVDEVVGLPIDSAAAIDELVAAVLGGLTPR